MRGRSIAIVAATVLVASGVTLTARAAWTGSASVDAGTITAGHVALGLGPAGSATTAYPFSALDGTDLGPGAVRQAPLRVENTGNVDLRYRTTGAVLGALDGQASVTWSLVSGEAGCPASGPPSALPGDPTIWRALAPAQAEVWCIRVTLGPNPPQALAASSVSFGFAAEQLRHA